MKQKSRALTLLELLIAIMLIGVVIIAIANIETFSRYHVIASDRRAKLQNEVSFALDHMNKNITNAIGTIMDSGVIREATGVRVRVDTNGNGQIDPADIWVAYRHEDTTSGTSFDSVIRYYPNIETPGVTEVIAHKILIGTDGLRITGNFDADGRLLDSFFDVAITARWNPDPAQLASPDNPEVNMQVRIHLPSVSVH